MKQIFERESAGREITPAANALLAGFQKLNETNHKQVEGEKMSEAALQKKIQAYLKHRKAWTVKQHGSGFTRGGIPDLLVCYRGYFIALEVKFGDGKPSSIQVYEMAGIRAAQGLALVVRSLDDVKDALDSVDKELEQMEKIGRVFGRLAKGVTV